MKKLILILSCVLALSACKEEKQEAQAKPVVKIGVGLPLSGNMASIGNAAHKALIASFKEINKNPKNKYYYELITENDEMNPKLVNNIAHKLIFNDKVNVIISYFSVANRIVAPMAAENKLINFMIGFGDDSLISPYNFQNFLTVEAENEAVVEFFKKHKVKNVDLVYQNIGAADEFLNPLLPKLESENIGYTVHRFNKGERDFKILISKIKESLSEAVFIYAFEPEADILTQEIRTQNLKKYIAYNDGLPMTNNYLIYEGYYNIGSIITPEDLKRTWGLDGQNAAYAMYLYDMGKIIAGAYENAPTQNKIPNADELSKYLHSKSKYSGLVGDFWLDEKGQFHSKGQSTIVKNGQMTIEE